MLQATLKLSLGPLRNRGSRLPTRSIAWPATHGIERIVVISATEPLIGPGKPKHNSRINARLIHCRNHVIWAVTRRERGSAYRAPNQLIAALILLAMGDYLRRTNMSVEIDLHIGILPGNVRSQPYPSISTRTICSSSSTGASSPATMLMMRITHFAADTLLAVAPLAPDSVATVRRLVIVDLDAQSIEAITSVGLHIVDQQAGTLAAWATDAEIRAPGVAACACGCSTGGPMLLTMCSTALCLRSHHTGKHCPPLWH